MSLFLVGMRGTGKSSAGALAAMRLGVPFVDVDAAIESRTGRRVSMIFRDEGEQAFRALEREVLLEVLPRPGRLCAPGAGCVLDAEVRAALRRYGRVVWLTAPAEVLTARIRGSDRPSLTGADPAEEVAVVAAAREPLYRECADEIVATFHRSIEEVASVIEQLWAVLPHHQLR